MWRSYQIFIPLLSLFVNRVDLTDLFPLEYKVKILKVLDGDTVMVGFSRQVLKVRISKIDSPEMNQPYWNKKGNAGLDARNCLKKTIYHKKEMNLIIFGQDIYGRILGDLDRLSFDLIRRGCTGLYPYAKFSSKHEKWTYIRALDNAKKRRVGLWRRGGYYKPSLWRKRQKRKFFGKK